MLFNVIVKIMCYCMETGLIDSRKMLPWLVYEPIVNPIKKQCYL